MNMNPGEFDRQRQSLKLEKIVANMRPRPSAAMGRNANIFLNIVSMSDVLLPIKCSLL